MKSFLKLAFKSLFFDIKFLRIVPFPFTNKLGFIFQKYIALLGFRIGRQATIKYRNLKFKVSNLQDLGTLQSCIIDFYNDIVCPGIIVRSRPIILDIGANVGQFCNAAKLFFPDAEIYSFEPNPEVYELLKKNVSNFTGVTVFNCGVGDKKEDRPFYVHEISGMSSFKKYSDYPYNEDKTKTLKLEPLDSMVSLEEVDLMKIDVEGFETEVIMGSIRTLKSVNYLVLELSLLRDQSTGNNLSLLCLIHKQAPTARIMKFGRPLGDASKPSCQDLVLEIKAQ